MDYSTLDEVRRTTTPLQLDTVEAFARGTISRREFVRRGLLIGLTMPSIVAVVAACGGGGSPAPGSSGAPGTSTAPGGSTGTVTTGGTIKVACQKPVKLDTIAMQDLAAYGITAQSFEFLCTLAPNATDIAPGLAEKWTPNADNSVWVFNLRKGVKWQDGTDFTADDVVATMERMVTAGTAAIKGVIAKGSAVATDPNTVTFNLAQANGNFPYLVSVFNAQSLITPKDYATGTTLDKKPAGTGPWKLDKYDVASGAKFSRNETWWGGKTPLDSVEWVFFDDTAAMVTAMQGGQVDAIVQFDVLTGAQLFDDPNLTVVSTPTANHRQIWMRTDTGVFKDKRVRQAFALTIDRPTLVSQLFKDKAIVGNDHVIAPFYPYFDDSVPQRTQNIEMAKQLLSDAGATNVAATLEYGQQFEIADLAVLLQSNAAKAGITITPHGQDNGQFYGAAWCPEKPADPPCSGATEFGIVDYGHRPTPDLYCNAALQTKGVWNSSQYSSPEFDAAFKEFQSAVGVDAQKVACKKIETILNEDVPIALPYFYNYLSGNSKKFTGVYTSALGQMFLNQASQV
ncbi:MAG: ABC transporter substrate-binding protein [Chloroflexi bacterium]|nr:ABC transporter substrate-binding protein [Chloroflexota bacterium]